ncbi:MAG: M23 family metallopeptidase [Myxococcota bacterium]|nr:M23 family metallopeptidase [Myxococcota bacterium]
MTRALVAVLLAWSAGASAQVSPLRPDPMRPGAFTPSEGDECRARERGRDGAIALARVCDGPRRVPVPTPEQEARAEALEVGTRSAADRLRIGRPHDAWMEALEGVPPRDDLLWPVARGLFSRGFGRVRRREINHRPHDGVDIVAEEGETIRAARDGLVVYADNGVSGYGNLLVLLHPDATATFYAHCRAIWVTPGQRVARGQGVAEVGATGRAAVPHLHFEWRRRGRALDPMPRFVERPPADAVRPEGEEGFAPPPPNRAPDRVPDGQHARARRATPDRWGRSARRRVAMASPRRSWAATSAPR